MTGHVPGTKRQRAMETKIKVLLAIFIISLFGAFISYWGLLICALSLLLIITHGIIVALKHESDGN